MKRKSTFMKMIQKFVCIGIVIVALASCKKEKTLTLPDSLSLGGDTWAKGPIDQWLYDSITKPYNIEVKYRWDPWEVQLDATLVPPKEDKVIPAMSAIKQIWIDPYTLETGSELFIKKYSPKSFVLIGSPQYQYNGTIVLGQAEGGKKIEMFVINDFDKSNNPQVRQMLHTIEHEFAHILHQNVLYPPGFKTITPNYTSNWFNVSEAQAHSEGFATAYSESGPDDDFVEMIATMLVEGKNRWEELVTAQNAAAQTALRQKEQIVVNYYRNVWNIDFYSLQKRTQDALNRISPSPALNTVFGFGKSLTRASVNPGNTSFLPQGSAFTTIFNTAKAGLAGVGGAGRVLDSMAVIFNYADSALLRLYYHNTAGTLLQANFTYAVSKDANGVYTFTYAHADANGDVIASGVTALTNYFKNNTFKIDWYIDPNNTLLRWRAAFTPQQTANASFTGLLLP
jgi:substrate import-associated zinc metallohydrolase lipoprotein